MSAAVKTPSGSDPASAASVSGMPGYGATRSAASRQMVFVAGDRVRSRPLRPIRAASMTAAGPIANDDRMSSGVSDGPPISSTVVR